MSGPAILKLSAWGARALHEHRYQATLQLNWLPDQNPEQVRQSLMTAKADMTKRAIATYAPVPLPRRLWQYLVQRAEIDSSQKWAELSKKALNRLVQELTQGQYPVRGKGVFKEEFVTCGGVPLSEVDFKTMQSRRCPGLYFAGEVLDIDGVTGGFNFQSAWTTGWIAGQSMGTKL
jgi:predicted Rossmann fold flavoprotein